jgi:ATP-binding cassette subfamily C protein LapB
MSAVMHDSVADTEGTEDVLIITNFERIVIDFCKEFGRQVRIDILRSRLPEGVDQADIEHINDVALTCGLKFTEKATLDLSSLDDSDYPALVQYKGESDRYVVLLRKTDADRVDVLDKTGVTERVPLFEQDFYHNAARVFNVQFDSTKEDSKWAWLTKPLIESKWAYGQVFLAALLINFLALSTSIFTMVVYDRVLPNNASESLVALTIGVGIALGFDIILKMLRGWFLDGAGSRADTLIGEKLFEQLIALDISGKRDSIGGLSSVMREFESLREFMTSATLVALIDLPFIVIFLFVIYALGGPIVLVPLVLVVAVLLVGVLAQPFLNRLAQQAISEGKNKQSILVETLSGIEVLKTSMAGREMRRRWRESLTTQSSSAVKSRAVSQFVVNFSAFAQQLAQVGIVVVGAHQVAQGNITLGGLIAAVILAGRSMAPLSQIANVLTRIVHARASFKALGNFMSLPLDRRPNARLLQKETINGDIEFRGVSFQYDEKSRKVIDQVSFKIKKGEKVALLGKIGSGKSTVARLLYGLYEPTLGSVLIDGVDVRQIEPFDLKRNMSLILQDSWLFSGSVRDNIASGAPVCDDEDLLRSAEISGANDFLADHPSGFDLQLAEAGGGLSGGQKQSISIARGLVGNPSVLVMDEATSMMDMGSESKFVERLGETLTDQTLIVITHRSAMLQLVDRVIVFDKGRIVADGPKSILNKGNKAAA